MADKNPQPQQPAPLGMFPPPPIQAQPDMQGMAMGIPAAPQQMQDFIPTAMQESQQGRQGLATEAQRIQNNISRQQQLEDYVRQMSGHLAYQPHMAPMTGQGIGHDILNVLGNLGRGALTGLAATGPGQAIQNVAYSQPRAYVADAIREIQQRQGQNAVEGELARTYGGEATHALYPAARYGGEQLRTGTEVQIAGMNDATRRLIDQHRTALEAQANQIRMQLGQGKITQEAARTEMMGLLGNAHNEMMRDVAGMVSQRAETVQGQQAAESTWKTQVEHPLLQMLGLAPEPPTQRQFQPTTPQAQPAPQQQKGGTSQQKPQGKPGQQGKGTVTLTSGGRRYNIPRHMVGEFKKDHPDAR